MDELFKPEEKKRGINPVFVVGLVVGMIVIGAAIYLLSFKPPMDQQMAKILEGAIREGSPEFAELSKDILISRSDDTVESPMGMGTISMFIKGTVKNKGTRTISVLEVNVIISSIKDVEKGKQVLEVLREKRVLVVPVQNSVLAPGDTVPINLTMDGFDRKDHRDDIKFKVTAIKVQ